MTKEQRKTLLKLARSTIEERLGIESKMPECPDDPIFGEKRGAFVSLHMREGHELRGCIGNIEPVYPLWEAIARNAISAAFSDPRFWPMTAGEFPEVQIEISVLTVPKSLDYKDGKDLLAKLAAKKPGVIIKKGWAEATFLPQVWEQLSDAEVFLTHLCLKAGLEGTAFRTEKLEVLTYGAEVFGE